MRDLLDGNYATALLIDHLRHCVNLRHASDRVVTAVLPRPGVKVLWLIDCCMN